MINSLRDTLSGMKKQLLSFIHNEISAGLCLIFTALLALILANSSLAGWYQDFIDAPLRIGLTVRSQFYGLEESVSHWINDALMAIFFLMIGLEIKREIVQGELSNRSRALQPLFAVMFGMATPVLIYSLFHWNNAELMHGWAVACSTDIAFALAILTLVGPRVPPVMKVILTATAVLDDLIAILIIAVFYSKTIQLDYLLLAAVGVIGLIVCNRRHVTFLGAYMGFGFLVWLGFLHAGLHPTLAGVMTALCVPLRGKNKRDLSPSARLEAGLHPVVSFVILPLFTLANAGLSFAGLSLKDILQPLPLSVLMGLSLGKPVGIMTGLGLGHVTGLARKPGNLPWSSYFGIALLCGMGFTIPLFISDQAFTDSGIINQIKLGVLSACLLSACIGWGVCRIIFSHKRKHHV